MASPHPMHATAMLPSDAESRSAMLLHQTTSECECDSNVVADDSEAHEWLNEVGRLQPNHVMRHAGARE